MIRFLIVMLSVTTLSGCAARGVIGFADVVDGVERRSVYVATNRIPAPLILPQIFDQEFGDARETELKYLRMDVSIPPTHETGKIEWPEGGALPNPLVNFAVSENAKLDGPGQFVAQIKRDLEPGQREVVVFVHGYNVNNAEAVYRVAQVSHDYRAKTPAVLFSWPSAGHPRGYAYDRDSVIFSRDALEELLTLLSDAGLTYQLVAHSMGSQLVMETLRQMSISGNRAPLRKLTYVALISPDIDEDVFRQQASRITPFPQPFVVMVSHKDRALNASAWLTGRPSRLGSIQDPKRLEDVPITIIDLTDVVGGDRVGHATAFTAPGAIERLRKLAVGG